ncbi:MAG: hypothetical protein HY331_16305 [Chloroflexi bacterium]|nr:hypothetical protein [Chloroflexota bacterium]
MGLIVNGEFLFLPPLLLAIPLGAIVGLGFPATVLLYGNRFHATFTIEGR